MADDEEDFSSLPLPDRFAHKNWKVRKEGYEAATKTFEAARSEQDPVVRTFVQDSGLWKTAVGDSNVAAQQEAVVALCAFLEVAGAQGSIRSVAANDLATATDHRRTRDITLSILVEKALISTKPITKQKAADAILLYVEMDKAEPVITALLPCLTHKLPKVRAACLTALTSIYHAFGTRIAEPKPALTQISKMFADADKAVREAAFNLAVELYRWLGEPMKKLFWEELKPVQQNDLQKAFDAVKDEPSPEQTRYLISQNRNQATQAAAADSVDAPAEDEEPEVDLEPEYVAVNVLPKVAKDFYDNIGSAKWKERLEALEQLLPVLSVPKIEDNNFNEMIGAFAKCMKDANINVVAIASNCVTALANGLKKDFAKHRSTIVPPMLERLKEKKQVVTDAIGAALDAVVSATSLADNLHDTLEFMKHKNPNVKLETTKFLVRALKATKQCPSSEEISSIGEVATKSLADSLEAQRNAAAEVLGTLLKIMGEEPMARTKILQSLDDIRMAKIREFASAADVKAKFRAAPPPKAAAAAAATSRSAPTKRPIGPSSTVRRQGPPPAATSTNAARDDPPSMPAAPLLPKPTAKPALARPGAAGAVARGVRPAVGGTSAPRRPQSGAPPASPGPQSRLSPSPASSPQQTAPRALTARTLTRPTPAPPVAATQAPEILQISSAERLELQGLRAQLERLRSANETLQNENVRLQTRLQEMETKSAELIENHTSDTLQIQAKTQQLTRARVELTNAEDVTHQQQREIDRLKRELSRMNRIESPRSSDIDGGRGAYSNNTLAQDGTNGSLVRDASVYRPRGASPSRVAREGKENRVSADGSSMETKPSHLLSGRPPGRTLGSAPSPAPMTTAPNPAPSERIASGTSDGSAQSRGTASRVARHPSQFSNGSSVSAVTSAGTDSGGVESWRRAAEVTQNLKARIEQMKVFQLLGVQKVACEVFETVVLAVNARKVDMKIPMLHLKLVRITTALVCIAAVVPTVSRIVKSICHNLTSRERSFEHQLKTRSQSTPHFNSELS
ncbi:hypothetical protein MRB53_037948 [Persea americana]|nr:hypothetical protein MRB53_037948 [Persea americana]